jgi:hypothetical protein
VLRIPKFYAHLIPVKIYDDQIKDNEKLIAKYRIELKNENSKPQERNGKKLDAMEKKNHELKAKLENCKNDGKSDWKEFRTGFNQELHDLGQAFKDFSTRSTD